MHRGKRYTVYLTKEQYLQYQEVMKNYPRDAALLSAAVILLGLGIQLGANSIAGGTFVGSNVEQVVENEGQFTKFNWEIINGTQELIEGTNVPKSFVINNLTINGNKIWVHANATKHIGKFIKSANCSNAGALSENEIMNSFLIAVKQISGMTLKMGDNQLFVNGWEIGINGETGVIYHALMR